MRFRAATDGYDSRPSGRRTQRRAARHFHRGARSAVSQRIIAFNAVVPTFRLSEAQCSPLSVRFVLFGL